MNQATYRVMADAIDNVGVAIRARRQQKLEQEARKQQDEERELRMREIRARIADAEEGRADRSMERTLRMQKIRQDLAEAGEVRADRALAREIEPIRLEGQRYDDQRAIVEDRMAQALKRRDSLEQQIERERENRMKRALLLKDMKAGPTAKITRKAGDVTASYDVPVADIEKSLGGGNAYQSPYAADVLDLDRRISENEAEIAGGDNRTGFLGVGTSRRGVIDKAKQQRLQLKAMELREMLERGIISQEEADRRAAVLMGR